MVERIASSPCSPTGSSSSPLPGRGDPRAARRLDSLVPHDRHRHRPRELQPGREEADALLRATARRPGRSRARRPAPRSARSAGEERPDLGDRVCCELAAVVALLPTPMQDLEARQRRLRLQHHHRPLPEPPPLEGCPTFRVRGAAPSETSGRVASSRWPRPGPARAGGTCSREPGSEEHAVTRSRRGRASTHRRSARSDLAAAPQRAFPHVIPSRASRSRCHRGSSRPPRLPE